MHTELLIERWFAIGMLLFGFSHAVHPGKWAALFLPAREGEAGGLMIATFTLPLGLIVILTHNVWVWGLPVIVTLLGWAMSVKSVIYLFFPGAARRVMPAAGELRKGFRIAGAVMILLGILIGYEAFFRK